MVEKYPKTKGASLGSRVRKASKIVAPVRRHTNEKKHTATADKELTRVKEKLKQVKQRETR